jgi:ubiquinone/menaquinone biosynthesis C-methylase UbiE
VNSRYPQFRKGIEEARAVDPQRFEQITEMYLDWAMRARGENAIERCTDAFVQFTTEVNLAQVRYEAEGHYEHQSFDQLRADHYSDDQRMAGYLWGVYLTNYLWAHHMEIAIFFRDRFVQRLESGAHVVEIAPGHGGWGVWALTCASQATLRGYDISRSSIAIAQSIAGAAGVADRAAYKEGDALQLGVSGASSADACICCFLLEHLERPQECFSVIGRLLRPGGRAFITAALTSAQVDHIYEFRHESELYCMAEQAGLHVAESLSAMPRRRLPHARFLPRAMGLVAEKREPVAR